MPKAGNTNCRLQAAAKLENRVIGLVISQRKFRLKSICPIVICLTTAYLYRCITDRKFI